MQYEYGQMFEMGVDRYDYVGDVADRVFEIIARHPNTNHRKLGNVEIVYQDGLTYIRCNECGNLHPVFLSTTEGGLYSGNDYPTNKNSLIVRGKIWIGYDENHVLTACCHTCRSYCDIYRCPICSSFHYSGYRNIPSNIKPIRTTNHRYGGYTIHGYDNNGNYDTYEHCCYDCLDKRVSGDTGDDYRECEECGEIFLIDDLWWMDEDNCYYCGDCFNQREAELEAEREAQEYEDSYDDEWHEVSTINDYHGGNHSQKDLGDALMFGAEYEIKCFDLYDDTDDREQFCNGLNNYGAITRDASVDLEIVTKPMSLPDLRENILNLAEYCSKHHVRAWNGGFCGLHIHINRGGIRNFTNIYHFLNEYKTELHKLSGRDFTSSATHYCQFDFPAGDDELLEACNNYTRYLAVNLQNKHTVEFRFLRNTTKRDRLEAYFDFLKTLFENDEDLPNMTWTDLIEKTNNDFLYDMFGISK